MKNKFTFLRTLLFLIFTFLGKGAFATHIVGVDLYYTWVAGNTYQITMAVYGDCAGASFPALSVSSPVICIYDASTSIGSINLALQAPTNGVEITPVCPADSDLTQCTSLAYTIPGIKKFIFTGTYTLPYTSATWRFLFTGNMGTSGGSAGRGSTITNIVGPGSSIIQLVDTLNNTVYHNTSAQLTVLPTPFFCLGVADNYNPGAHDPDGDSLAFSLISAYNGTAVCTAIGGLVTYSTGFSPTAPLATSAFTFNNFTGQISFTPNALQRSLVVYNIDEYRLGTTFVGSCQREMSFLVLTCTDPPPTGGFSTSSAGTIVDSSDFDICQNVGPFTITLRPTESDTFNNITVTATGLPTGATFTTVNNSTNHPVCTFGWSTTGVAVGTYTFYVTFQDNNCPLAGTQTRAYTITVLPVPTVLTTPGASVCQGVSTTLTASGAVSYVWAPGTGLSCIPCATTIATPLGTTLYTVTGTATNGCTNTDTVRVTVKPLPVIVAGTATAICIGASAPLTASGGVSYTWAPGSTLSCTACTNPTATPLSTTTYNLTGTGANGCVNTSAVTITVNPLPVITVPAASVCAGNSVTLMPTGAVSYVWSPATGLSCTACTNPIANPAITTTYTVTGTNANGCVNSTTITVNVSPLPAPPTVISPVNYCLNATAAALTATGTSLLWYTSSTGGVGSGIAPVPPTTTVGSTTWYVSQTVTGCESNRDSITVIVKPLPAITISPAAASICIGQSTTFTASGGVSYRWSPGTSLSSTVTAAVTANPASTIIYTVTGTGANGCTDTASILVTVNPLPVIIITPVAPTICIGSDVVLTASGALTYTWTPSATLSSGAGSSVTATPVVTTSYAITGTDINGCVNTGHVTVTVNPIPTAPIVISPLVYCQNTTAPALTATGAALLWYTVATGGVGSATAPIPPTTTAGSTTWYVSQTVGGCESPRTPITVNINPLPPVVAGPTGASICIGQSVELIAGGGLSYLWTPGTALSVTTGAHVWADPSTTTTYTVTGTDINHCSNSASVTVTVHPLPVITVVPANASICFGSSITLTVSGASTYVWSPAATLNNSAGPSVVATPPSSIIYSVTGTDVFGCVNTSGTAITVNPIPPAPLVTTPVFYCQHAPAIPLIATGTSLLWYNVGTGGTGSATDPVPNTDNLGTTLWFVSQTVNGCESPRDTIAVIVTVNAETGFDFSIKYGCVEDTVSFTNTSQYAYKYIWYFGDKNSVTDTDTNPVHYYRAEQETSYYTVKLVGFNPVCYEDSTIQTLTLNPSPHIYFLSNVTVGTTIPLGSSVQLNVDGGTKYLWSPDNGTLSDPNINNPVATPVENTIYLVYGYNENGCEDSANVDINVYYNDSEFLPSAFTPNGDGLNDIFKIGNLRYDKLDDFSIFNRWGQLVYKSNDADKGWDGTFNGVKQDLGVYNYLVVISRPDHSQIMLKGTVTLIR